MIEKYIIGKEIEGGEFKVLFYLYLIVLGRIVKRGPYSFIECE